MAWNGAEIESSCYIYNLLFLYILKDGTLGPDTIFVQVLIWSVVPYG